MRFVQRFAIAWVLVGSTVEAQVPPSAPQIIEAPPPSLVGVRDLPLLAGPRQEPGLTVYASGTAPISAEWFRNGQSVAQGLVNAGVTVFRINSAQSSDAGDYHVVLTNAVGTAASPVVNVRVVEPLLITTQPQSVVRAPGATVTLSVSATGEEPISYQWYRESGEAVDGATGSTLRLTLTADPAPFRYSVVVSNPWQSRHSASASIVPLRPPVITGDLPTALLLRPSFLTLLGVDYEGPPSATIEWRKNGAVIPGATNPALALLSEGVADTSEYTMTLTNPVGTITSQTCRVTSMPTLRFVDQPANTRGNAGQSLTLSAGVAGGHEPYTFQWYTNSGAYSGLDAKVGGATSTQLVLPNLGPAHARRYAVEVTDASGTVIMSDAVAVTVMGTASTPQAPVFLAEPEAPPFAVAGTFQILSAVAPGATQFVWQHNGAVISGATGSSLILQPLTLAATGDYAVTASNSTGKVTSRAVHLTVLPQSGLRSSTPAATHTATAGTHVHLSASVTGANPIFYQWQLNGANLSGQTNRELVIYNATAADAGVYTLQATADVGTIVTPAQTLVVKPPAARVTNVSVRTWARPGAQSLIAGFSIAGTGGKSLLIRGIGPALADFAVTDVLPDPELVVTNQAGLPIAHGREYNGDPLLADTFARVGAFPLRSSARDAALILTASPAAYSVRVASRSNTPGIALAELYDLDSPASAARIDNVSVRAQLDPAAPLIVGFSVAGDGPINLLLRAVGPTLSQFGVPDALADLTLELHATVNGQDRVVARNEAWGGSAVLGGAFRRLGAFGFGLTSQDCAVRAALRGGSYTLVVKGRNGATGVALAEIYVFQ